jgi:hypothetical protein
MKPEDTSKGKAYLWKFEVLEGEETGKGISDFSDANYAPSTKNKSGRWLAAIAKKPLKAKLQVDPDLYVGKRYMVIVEDAPSGGGKTKIVTFTQLA